MTYGNVVILAGSDVTEEGWYWRTPGIPVKVKRRTDGRLWFFGFGLAGPVDDHHVPYIQWCGPMVAPRPLQGMDTVQLQHGDPEILVNALKAIVHHQTMMGKEMSELSTTKYIALRGLAAYGIRIEEGGKIL